MVKNISITLNAKQRIEREGIRGIKGRASRECMPTNNANNNAISVDRDPVHVYLQDVQRKTTTIHARTGVLSFYLSVNYFKTETHASVEGKNRFKVQPMGVNKLNNTMKIHDTSGGNFRQNKLQW